MQNSLFLHQRLHSLSLCYFFYSLSSTQHSLSLAFNNLKSSKISISSNLIYLLKPWLVVKAPESFFCFFAFYFKGKEESKKRADADGSKFFLSRWFWKEPLDKKRLRSLWSLIVVRPLFRWELTRNRRSAETEAELRFIFFVVLACHLPELDGFNWHYQASSHCSKQGRQ